MNQKESARMTSDRSPVLQTLIQFYEYALSRRDVKRAAELLTEDVFFVGTAESIADRQNFERSFREKLRHIPNRTLYEISDYREKARGENTWDCTCKIHLIFPDREERCSVIGTIVCPAKSFEPSQMVEEELLFKEWCRNSWNGLPEETIQKKMLALVTCSYGSRDERTICFAVAEN